MPVLPQSPAREKEWFLGRRRLAELAVLYFSKAVRHSPYSFSSTDCEVCSNFSLSLLMIFDFESRGWFIYT